MDWGTIELIVTVSVFPLLFLAWRLDLRHQAKSVAAWREVSEHTGLHFRERGAADQELEGSYRGYEVHVTIETIKVQSGRSTTTLYVTTVAVKTLESAAHEAVIDPREPYDLADLRWKATTKSFAAAFRQNDSEAARWLADDPELRNAFASVQATGDNLELREGQVIRSRQHLFAKFGELLKFVNSAIDLAARVDRRMRLLAPSEELRGEVGEEAEALATSSSSASW